MTDFYSAQSDLLSPGKTPDGKPRNIERNLSERVAYVLKAYQRFGPMCYNEYPGKGTGETGKAEIWGSIEDIHNWVHGLIGDKGQMGQVPKSAFDPIFWLHHT
jgi:tyrosinase